jgi:type VI secretion system protein VasD
MMGRRVRPRLLALAAFGAGVGAIAFAGVACSSSQTPAREPQACTQQIVGMTVIASPKINPSETGAARPVQVRLYQLKTDTRILNASFEQIWKEDKATLQDDLVKVEEFPVYPFTRAEVKFERDSSALFLVAVALFRNPRGRTWWTEFELPSPPGKGNCMMPSPKCAGPDCQLEAGPPPLAPHFALWIDETRIDDGADHLDEYPDATPIRELFLRFSPPAGQPVSQRPAAARPAEPGVAPAGGGEPK